MIDHDEYALECMIEELKETNRGHILFSMASKLREEKKEFRYPELMQSINRTINRAISKLNELKTTRKKTKTGEKA